MDIDDLVGALRTQRDELRVRLHLMKAELRDEYEELEGRWNHLDSRLDQLKGASKESADDIGAAVKQVAEEIGAAYDRMKNSMK